MTTVPSRIFTEIRSRLRGQQAHNDEALLRVTTALCKTHQVNDPVLLPFRSRRTPRVSKAGMTAATDAAMAAGCHVAVQRHPGAVTVTITQAPRLDLPAPQTKATS